MSRKSPRYRRSRSSGDSDSISSEVAEDSSEDAFKHINLMDANSLEPMLMESRPKTPDKKKESRKTKDSPKHTKSKESKKAKIKKKKDKKKKTTFNDDIFSSFGLQTVDDLLGGIPSSKDDEPASVASEISEVKTESDEIHTEKAHDRHQQNLPVFGRKPVNDPFSVSEIRTQVTNSSRRHYSDDFDDSISERIGVSTKASKIKTVSEIKTRYSGDDTFDDYSESFDSDTESIATVSKTSQTSEKTLDDSRTADTESYSYTRSVASPVQKNRKSSNFRHIEVQTSEPGLKYQWSTKNLGYPIEGYPYGLGFVDPTPIATHVISPDALESMTAYSPCMLALHDMLKQQLQLTREFIQSQQHLHKIYTESIESNYQYTTLESTKEYIRKHRKKKLTFKEALKLVDKEMAHS